MVCWQLRSCLWSIHFIPGRLIYSFSYVLLFLHCYCKGFFLINRNCRGKENQVILFGHVPDHATYVCQNSSRVKKFAPSLGEHGPREQTGSFPLGGSVSPVSNSYTGQSLVSVKSFMWKRADSAFVCVSYTALWLASNAFVKASSSPQPPWFIAWANNDQSERKWC